MNKKGQGGMGLLMGLMTAVLVFMMMSAFLPSIVQMIGVGKGSDSANCPSYTDPNAAALGDANKSYNSNLGSDTITCSILNFTPGMFVLSIVFAVIAGIISGRFASSGPEPQYGSYPQYG